MTKLEELQAARDDAYADCVAALDNALDAYDALQKLTEEEVQKLEELKAVIKAAIGKSRAASIALDRADDAYQAELDKEKQSD